MMYEHRHANSVQLKLPYARTNTYKNSFMLRTMNNWNSLGFDVCSISSITEFKSNNYSVIFCVVYCAVVYRYIGCRLVLALLLYFC